jgi:methyl-accepting chemotaxis protein
VQEEVLTKTNISGRILLLTTLLVFAVICSLLAALDIAASLMTIGAVACSGAGVTIWLWMLLKPAGQPWRSHRGTVAGGAAGHAHLFGTDGYPAVADEILGGRSCCKDAVRMCYELAARVSCARQIAQTTGTSVLGAIDDIRGKCLGLRDSLSQLNGTVERLRSSVDASSRLASGAVSHSDGVESVSPALGSVLDEVIASVRDMAETLRDVDQNAKDLITSTEETAYSMSRLDSFLQDMADSGKELESSTDTANRVALEGAKVVGEMAKENEAIITTVKEAAAAVEDLGRWSQEVGKIVEVIRDIADETNLLALNAAIIAAQSGEHGKAFGVVAEEIRGLAERTSSSTHEISDLVKTVQKNVANVVQGMKKSLQRVERGELLTRNAGMVLEKVFESFESARSMAKQIATSTFEHKIDSSHVVRSIQRVTDIAKRLEAHKFSKWTVAGETAATARMIKALTHRAGTAALEQGASDGVQTATDLVSSTCVLGGSRHVSGLLSRGDEDLGRSLASLECMRENMAVCMAAFDDIAGAVRSAVKQIKVEADGHGIRRCWEITGCDDALRTRCQAYTQDDWRCFLSDGVACSFAEDGDAHAERRCHECPAFKNNLEALLTQMVHS